MFSLLPNLHQKNQWVADYYLHYVFRGVSELTLSIGTQGILDSEHFEIINRFGSHLRMEEEHLKRHLETIDYRIEDYSTLVSVVGRGRIEKVY